MSTAYRFELLTLSPNELERLSELLLLVFPAARHLTPRYLQWHLADNPDGPAIGCNAFQDDTMVGHMAAMPMRVRVDGAEMRALFMTNGAVHPAHRGRKLQSRISDALFEEAARQGFPFVLGTGNRYSTGPLLTRFRMIAPLNARIGWGPPRHLDTGLVPAFERCWSDEALRWRLANPERRYRVSHRGDDVTITAASGSPGIGATLYGGPNRWNLAERDLDLPGAGPLQVWIGLDPTIDWKRSTHVHIPMRLRPSPLNLVIKNLMGGTLHPDPSRMVFRAIDFDPY